MEKQEKSKFIEIHNRFLKSLLLTLLLTTCYLLLVPSASAGTIIKSPSYLGLNSGLVGYWNFDGPNIFGTSARDTSGQNKHGVISGATKTPGRLGQALDFDGVNDDILVTIGDTDAVCTIGDDDQPMTVAIWAKSDVAVAGVFQVGVENRYYIRWDSATGGDVGVWGAATTLSGLSLGRWHHISFTWTGGNGNGIITAFVDGQQVSQVTGETGDAFGGCTGLRIGSRQGSTLYNGQIDDVRIYNRALSDTEIARLYKIGLGSKANQTSAPDLQSAGLVGHWTFDGPDISGTRAKDKSGFNNHGTITGSALATRGKMGQGMNLDGVDDRVDAPNPDMTSYTYSMWVYVRSFTNGTGIDGVGTYFVDRQGSSNGLASLKAVSGNFAHQYRDNAAGGLTGLQGGAIKTNTWQHVVWGRQLGTEFFIYVDGVKASNNDTLGALTPDNPRIGSHQGGGATYTNGSIDDVRIYNRALSAAEIQNLYNQSQSKFNSSTTSGAIDKGLVGYWNFDGPNISGTRAKDTSGNNNHGTITGAVVAQGKIGQALSFDGSSSFVSGSGVNIASTPFAISSWFKVSSFPGNQQYFSIGSAAGTRTALHLRLPSATELRFALYDDDFLVNVPNMANRWVHAVVTMDNSFVRTVYIDGVAIESSQAAGYFTGDTSWNIGRWVSTGNEFFNGLIDDVRVYNRNLSAAEVMKLYQMGR